jgi:sugar/nucleoside kinase (ribokinase family)
MEKLSVFCYGEVGVDNIIQADQLPSPEIAVFPQAESYHIGGAAANTAVWLARMGVPVGLSGNIIGDDLYGRQLQGWLAQHERLDLAALEIVPGTTTPFTRAIVTPDGERSFLIFYYPQTPKSAFSLDMLKGAGFLALDLYGGPERVQSARAAHNAGVRTTIGDVIWPEHEALPVTDIVTNSGSYIRNVFPGVDVHQHARSLQTINKGIVITTDGGDEVFAIDRDGSAFVARPPKVEVVDATGAGDAFRAGLLYGLDKGLSLAESVCWGMATGSLKVGHVGAATTLPTFAEIEKLAKSLIARGVTAA